MAILLSDKIVTSVKEKEEIVLKKKKDQRGSGANFSVC